METKIIKSMNPMGGMSKAACLEILNREKAKILTINQVKGGVAKTTTATNLAAGLARKGILTLLVDADHQANATTHLLLADKPEHTIKDLLNGMDVRDVIQPTVEPNLDIIPSGLALSSMERDLFSRNARETLLKRSLAPVLNKYKVIIIDTQPSVGIIPINALTAADEVLIPVYESYSLDAIAQMNNVLKEVKSDLNPRLKVIGFLLTRYEPQTNLSKELKQALIDRFGDLVFETIIPKNVKLSECIHHKKSIYEYDPDCAGAKAYEKLTEELLKRWEMDK
jgi:chromosome partitioning protein